MGRRKRDLGTTAFVPGRVEDKRSSNGLSWLHRGHRRRKRTKREAEREGKPEHGYTQSANFNDIVSRKRYIFKLWRTGRGRLNFKVERFFKFRPIAELYSPFFEDKVFKERFPVAQKSNGYKWLKPDEYLANKSAFSFPRIPE